MRFTVEDNKEDGAIPFLDTIVKPEADGILSVTVYRKPIHTDQYLQWDSHHHPSAKYSVLIHGAKTVCNNSELLQREMEHLRKALTHYKYPKWALDRMERRFTKPTSEVSNVANNQDATGAQPTTDEVKTKGRIVIPYTLSLCKSIKRICNRYGIQTHFKGNSTIKNLLVSPKDKDSMDNKIACDEEYIGESFRTLGERFKQHLKEPSPLHNHSNNTGHTTTQDKCQIVGREDHRIAKTIKESIYIGVTNPTLNRNIGTFNLHHIQDRVLLNTPGLKIKRHAQDIGHAQWTQPNTPM